MPDSVAQTNTTTWDADVSRLKEIEAQLARMSKVFMDGADPILIFDLDRRVLDMNHETERVFGWKRDELVGETTRHLLPPEFHELADSVTERLQHGETVRNYETAVRTKSGHVVPVLATSFLLMDETGRPVATAAIAKDITELKRTSETLQERNAELQQFADVLGHDLGAPLRTIRAFAELVQRDAGDELSERCREYLQFVVDGTDRMDCLITDLLSYSKTKHYEVPFESVDCDKVFKQALSNLQAAVSETHAEVTCDPLPAIHANATQMVQLFQNLIGNAIKFRSTDPPRVHVSAERRDGEWQFSVQDNGIGIDSQHRHKIFDVFRRLHTEDEFPGTGIGLAICRAIVERHGGRIWAESAKSRGSVIHFTITV